MTSSNDVHEDALIKLLQSLRHDYDALALSPRKVVLEHAIRACQSILSNQLEVKWHRHLYQQGLTQHQGLEEQLALALGLLEDISAPPDPEPAADIGLPAAGASLEVYCLGAFRLYRDHEPIDTWPKGRAKQLLKYLILNRSSPIPKEILMDKFWPDLDEGNARNNLNVAVYGLRQSLKKAGSVAPVLFQEGCYLLNPELAIWVDTEQFDAHLKAAARHESLNHSSEAIAELDKAEKLYHSDFLAEDIYEDWTVDLRESYRARYLALLRKLSEYQFRQGNGECCIDLNRKILSLDAADECAHCRLMECFERLGQRHLALRQYQLCTEALERDYGLTPAADTHALYQRIKNQQKSAGIPPPLLNSDAPQRLRHV